MALTQEDRLRLLGYLPPTAGPTPAGPEGPPASESPVAAGAPVVPQEGVPSSEGAYPPPALAPVAPDPLDDSEAPVGPPVPAEAPLTPEVDAVSSADPRSPSAPIGTGDPGTDGHRRTEAARAAHDAWLTDLTARAGAELEPMTGEPEADARAAQRNLNVTSARDELGRYRQAQAEGERARQESDVREQQAAEQRRVMAEAAERNERYRQQYEAQVARVSQAIDDMAAATPDPDVLLGGRGSWSRALVLALRYNASSLGAPQVAALIDDHMRSEMTRQRARFEGAQERVRGLTEGARAIGDMTEAFDKSDAARMAALERLAGTALQGIAARMSDPIQRAKLLQASANLHELALNKAQVEGAKAVADIQKTRAEAAKAARGTGAGGTGAAGDLRRGMWGPDGTWLPFKPGVKLEAPDQRALAGYNTTYRGLDDDMVEIGTLLTEMKRSRTLGGQVWDRWRSVNERRLDGLLNEVAVKLAKMRDPESVAREGEVAIERRNLPAASTVLGQEGEAVDSIVSDIRRRSARNYRIAIESKLGPGYADRFVETQSQKAYGEPPRRTASEYFGQVGDVPPVGPGGAPTAPTADELIGAIDAGMEAAARDGETADQLRNRLVQTRANLNAAYRRTQGDLLRMQAERDSQVRRGRAYTVEQSAALDSVQRAARAQVQALAHLQRQIDGEAAVRIRRAKEASAGAEERRREGARYVEGLAPGTARD